MANLTLQELTLTKRAAEAAIDAVRVQLDHNPELSANALLMAACAVALSANYDTGEIIRAVQGTLDEMLERGPSVSG